MPVVASPPKRWLPPAAGQVPVQIWAPQSSSAVPLGQTQLQQLPSAPKPTFVHAQSASQYTPLPPMVQSQPLVSQYVQPQPLTSQYIQPPHVQTMPQHVPGFQRTQVPFPTTYIKPHHIQQPVHMQPFAQPQLIPNLYPQPLLRPILQTTSQPFVPTSILKKTVQPTFRPPISSPKPIVQTEKLRVDVDQTQKMIEETARRQRELKEKLDEQREEAQEQKQMLHDLAQKQLQQVQLTQKQLELQQQQQEQKLQQQHLLKQQLQQQKEQQLQQQRELQQQQKEQQQQQREQRLQQQKEQQRKRQLEQESRKQQQEQQVQQRQKVVHSPPLKPMTKQAADEAVLRPSGLDIEKVDKSVSQVPATLCDSLPNSFNPKHRLQRSPVLRRELATQDENVDLLFQTGAAPKMQEPLREFHEPNLASNQGPKKSSLKQPAVKAVLLTNEKASETRETKNGKVTDHEVCSGSLKATENVSKLSRQPSLSKKSEGFNPSRDELFVTFASTHIPHVQPTEMSILKPGEQAHVEQAITSSFLLSLPSIVDSSSSSSSVTDSSSSRLTSIMHANSSTTLALQSELSNNSGCLPSAASFVLPATLLSSSLSSVPESALPSRSTSLSEVVPSRRGKKFSSNTFDRSLVSSDEPEPSSLSSAVSLPTIATTFSTVTSKSAFISTESSTPSVTTSVASFPKSRSPKTTNSKFIDEQLPDNTCVSSLPPTTSNVSATKAQIPVTRTSKTTAVDNSKATHEPDISNKASVSLDSVSSLNSHKLKCSSSLPSLSSFSLLPSSSPLYQSNSIIIDDQSKQKSSLSEDSLDSKHNGEAGKKTRAARVCKVDDFVFEVVEKVPRETRSRKAKRVPEPVLTDNSETTHASKKTLEKTETTRPDDLTTHRKKRGRKLKEEMEKEFETNVSGNDKERSRTEKDNEKDAKRTKKEVVAAMSSEEYLKTSASFSASSSPPLDDDDNDNLPSSSLFKFVSEPSPALRKISRSKARLISKAASKEIPLTFEASHKAQTDLAPSLTPISKPVSSLASLPPVDFSELDELSFRDLQQRCKQVGVKASGKREELLARLQS